MIRVILPAHLRTLARVNGEVSVEISGEPTLLSVLNARSLPHLCVWRKSRTINSAYAMELSHYDSVPARDAHTAPRFLGRANSASRRLLCEPRGHR